MKTLTPLHARDVLALRAIQHSWETRGYAPSIRELAAALASRSTSVSRYRIGMLERRGLLHVPRLASGEIVAHSMKVTDLGKQALAHCEEPA